jgi:nucleoid-associated protein YgaU
MIADLSHPYRRQRRTWDHERRLAIALAVAVALVVLLSGLVHANLSADGSDRVTVAPGDTVWSIAAQHTGGDVRDEVDAILQANHLSSPVIVPGQELVIPPG